MTRVVTWSASGSGMTSFLAALRPAVHHQSEFLDCGLHGLDEETRIFFSEQGSRLLDGQFPNQVNRDRHLQFELTAKLAGKRCSVEIEIVDPFRRPSTEGDTQGLATHVHHLYLHDPTQPRAAAVPVVNLMIDTLSAWSRNGDPYRLAVCVAKFDDPSIFATARDEGLLRPGNGLVLGTPGPGSSADFFARFAPDEVVARIRGFFRDEQTRYYVSSAAGLRRKNDSIDLHDFVNVKLVDGEVTLLTRGHPINIARPLLWLLAGR